MWHIIPLWVLVAGFAGAGIFNGLGTAATRDNFVRWGYPAWWCRVTGVLEVAIAILLAVPRTRELGLAFGVMVIAAAVITVVRRRDFSHLVPLGVFAALIAIVFVVS